MRLAPGGRRASGEGCRRSRPQAFPQPAPRHRAATALTGRVCQQAGAGVGARRGQRSCPALEQRQALRSSRVRRESVTIGAGGGASSAGGRAPRLEVAGNVAAAARACTGGPAGAAGSSAATRKQADSVEPTSLCSQQQLVRAARHSCLTARCPCHAMACSLPPQPTGRCRDQVRRRRCRCGPAPTATPPPDPRLLHVSRPDKRCQGPPVLNATSATELSCSSCGPNGARRLRYRVRCPNLTCCCCTLLASCKDFEGER